MTGTPVRQPTRVLLMAAAISAAPVCAQETSAVAAGAERFAVECSLCHGRDARGEGPFATLLKTAPPDLRRIALRNGGTFPADEVAATIDGRSMPIAHGTRDMPLFGRRYENEVPYDYDSIVNRYIEELVSYMQ